VEGALAPLIGAPQGRGRGRGGVQGAGDAVRQHARDQREQMYQHGPLLAPWAPLRANGIQSPFPPS